MYFLKDCVELKVLEKYGFRLGKNIPGGDRCIPEQYENNYWLVSTDEWGQVDYADEDTAIWSIHVTNDHFLWIECMPRCTSGIIYSVDNMTDMNKMFYILKCMIQDGILDDDYRIKEFKFML